MYATARSLFYQQPEDPKTTSSLPSQNYVFSKQKSALQLLKNVEGITTPKIPPKNEPKIPPKTGPSDPKTGVEDYSKIKVSESVSPKVWGKYFWTQLHLAATYYPENPSPIFQERMKARILAIPYEVPCANCRNHALSFLEKNESRLDKIVSGKHELGKFFTEFHNYVNERYGKPTWSYEKVLSHYGNPNFELK